MSASTVPPPPPPLLVVWDFDWSLIDENTDTWIFKALAPGLVDDLKRTEQFPVWTDRVQDALRRLFAEYGVTRDTLLETMQGIPIHQGMIETVSETERNVSRRWTVYRRDGHTDQDVARGGR